MSVILLLIDKKGGYLMARYVDVDEYLKGTFCDKFDDCTSEEECFECWARRHTEDVAPVVHAKWEEGYDGAYNGTFKCSNCGKLHSKANYCPNCGAKMDKE